MERPRRYCRHYLTLNICVTYVWWLGGEGSTGNIVDVTGWNKDSEV